MRAEAAANEVSAGALGKMLGSKEEPEFFLKLPCNFSRSTKLTLVGLIITGDRVHGEPQAVTCLSDHGHRFGRRFLGFGPRG
jgi:hypothetical protein